EDGVLGKKLGRSLGKFAEQFAAFAADALLRRPSPIGVSSLDEMLTVARLEDGQKQQVARAYTATTDRAAFWATVEAQLGKTVARRVASAARLGYLTINNAPLMAKLAEVVGEAGDAVALVRAG